MAPSLSTNLTIALQKFNSLQDYIINRYFRRFSVTAMYWSFAFIFIYFGLQKPAPVTSPPQVPISAAVSKIGIPVQPTLLFIGTYEIFLGVLFFFKQIRVVFWLFFAHQITTFLTLFMIPYVVFQPPWITMAGVEIPWALGEFSAFVLKNAVFVTGFMLLASIELGSSDSSAFTR